MCDQLTAEERAAIAAFPPERVQRIPRGVSGEATFMYDPLANGQLRSSKPIGWHEQIKSEHLAAKRARYHSHRRAARHKRRREVAEMHQQGMTLDQMAAHLDVAVSTIRDDLLAIRRVAE